MRGAVLHPQVVRGRALPWYAVRPRTGSSADMLYIIHTGSSTDVHSRERKAQRTASGVCPRLIKTASSGSFGFQGPGSHPMGSVQQFWLSIAGFGGRQWGWKS